MLFEFADITLVRRVKDVNVRRAMVCVMHTLVAGKSELSSVFMKDRWTVNCDDREAPMRTLMLDIDERVRKDTVDAVIELCVQNGDSVPVSLLRLIGDRWECWCTST